MNKNPAISQQMQISNHFLCLNKSEFGVCVFFSTVTVTSTVVFVRVRYSSLLNSRALATIEKMEREREKEKKK